MTNHYDIFPHLIFSDGISTITETSADTKVGVMLSIVLSSLTLDGKNVFLEAELNTFTNYIVQSMPLRCYCANGAG